MGAMMAHVGFWGGGSWGMVSVCTGYLTRVASLGRPRRPSPSYTVRGRRGEGGDELVGRGSPPPAPSRHLSAQGVMGAEMRGSQ